MEGNLEDRMKDYTREASVGEEVSKMSETMSQGYETFTLN